MLEMVFHVLGKNAIVFHVLGILVKVKSLKFQLSLTSIFIDNISSKNLRLCIKHLHETQNETLTKMKNDLITLVFNCIFFNPLLDNVAK